MFSSQRLQNKILFQDPPETYYLKEFDGKESFCEANNPLFILSEFA